QQEDSAHRLKRTQLNGIYQKVYVSKSLAENFRCQFTPSVASHGIHLTVARVSRLLSKTMIWS
uniref:Uncharacterized protein n=1 Tax=Aegilops tauschii subsp. strangulata TaxID=200361 RepID=A0A453MT41_AEGTS